MDDNINFENEESIQIDSGDQNDNTNHNPFMSNNGAPQNFNQPYADSPAP